MLLSDKTLVLLLDIIIIIKVVRASHRILESKDHISLCTLLLASSYETVSLIFLKAEVSS